MTNTVRKIAAIATLAILTTQPAHACWNSAAQNAVKISHLNMMLMTTALRCRNTSSDFLPIYNDFVRKHNALLGFQNTVVKAELTKTLGARGALFAGDELSVGFANRYGAGHPAMDCTALKGFAKMALDADSDSQTLVDTAQDALGETRIPGPTCTARPNVIAQK